MKKKLHLDDLGVKVGQKHTIQQRLWNKNLQKPCLLLAFLFHPLLLVFWGVFWAESWPWADTRKWLCGGERIIKTKGAVRITLSRGIQAHFQTPSAETGLLCEFLQYSSFSRVVCTRVSTPVGLSKIDLLFQVQHYRIFYVTRSHGSLLLLLFMPPSGTFSPAVWDSHATCTMSQHLGDSPAWSQTSFKRLSTQRNTLHSDGVKDGGSKKKKKDNK